MEWVILLDGRVTLQSGILAVARDIAGKEASALREFIDEA